MPCHRVTFLILTLVFSLSSISSGQEPKAKTAKPPILLKPARVFDGETSEAHPGWVVLVSGNKIVEAGPEG
jgi:hypothetical protein